MAEILGADINLPTVDISGFLSSSWIYVFIIGFIGFIAIIGVAVLLFFMTYNKKVELYENISGRGYVRTLVTRARTIKLGIGGEEVLKTLRKGVFLSSYGRKIARNTYMFVKGEDGYLYNGVHGDFDTKLAMLDIEPTNPNVRMFHVSLQKLADSKYGEKKNFIEKYGIHMMLFVFLLAMLIGFYVIAGKINEGLIASNNPQVAEKNEETAKILRDITVRLDAIQRNRPVEESSEGTQSGIVPATNITGGG